MSALPITESHREFYDRINQITGLLSSDRAMLDMAYEVAKAAHRGQWREGEPVTRYFEHPRAVFNILVDELGVQDDVLEDTSFFGNPRFLSASAWRTTVFNNIAKSYNEQIAAYVLGVTKMPLPQKVGQKTKQATKIAYYEQLRQAGDQTLLIKIADRLHNLRTIREREMGSVVTKVLETEEVYLPLFSHHTWSEKWRPAGELGMRLIQAELQELRHDVLGTR